MRLFLLLMSIPGLVLGARILKDDNWKLNRGYPGASPPKLDLTSTKTVEPEECTTSDNYPGRCVHYYQCNQNTKTIIEDGSNLIDIRYSQCSSIFHVCCRLTATASSKDTTTTPVSSGAGNTVPPAPRDTRKPTNGQGFPGASPPKLDLTPTKTEPEECTTSDNYPGRCVHYYQCNQNTKTIIEDGSNLIDIRYSQCSSIFHVCCRLTATASSKDTTTTPVSSGAGNTVPPAPRDTRKPTNGQGFPGASPPKLDLTPTKTVEPEECTTSDNYPGRCVNYYQCNQNTKTIIEDGSYLINIRYSQCSSIFHVCCRLTATASSKDTTTTPVSSGAGNTVPPAPRDTRKPTNGQGFPGASPPKLDLTPTKTEPEECTTSDNYPGRCVHYYQCNQNTKTIIEDGSNLIDIRYSQCSSIFHVCCRLTATASSKDTTTTPVSSGAGNTVPPAPRDTRKPTNGQGFPGASPPKLDLTPTKTVEPEECTTSDNYPGRCVNYYQCNQNTKTIIEDGSYLINIRSSQCSSIYHVCCRLTDLTATASSKDTSTAPVSGGEGNTKSPAPRDTRKPTNGQGFPGASPPKLDLTPTKTEPEECTTSDNYPGRCVHYYQCNQNTKTIIEDGSNLIDIRYSQCSSIFHVCCRLTATASSKDTTTTPVSSGAGNTVPPAPRDTRKPTNGQGFPGASRPKLDLTPTKTVEPEECTTSDNYPGRCVNYYQCNQNTKTIIEDGSYLINIRSSQCSSIYHVCCRLTDLTATASSKDTSTAPVSGGEGNTKSPAPRDTRKPTNGQGYPGASPPKLDLTPTKTVEPTECTTRDNYPGRCVNYYQCNQTTKTIIEDGSYLINIRSSQCSSIYHVCCRLTDLTATTSSKDPSTAPVSGGEGNTKSPTPRDTRKPTNGQGYPGASPPKLDLTPTKTVEPTECTTRDNYPGRCVNYYQCNQTTKTIIEDGSYLINIRSSQCSSIYHVCCRLTDLTATASSKDTSTAPVSGGEGNTKSPAPRDTRKPTNGQGYPGASPPKLDLTPTKTVEPEECTTSDNYPGRCVYYYQCSQNTKTIIEDGSSLIDIRSSRCSNAFHVCCRLTDLTATANSSTSTAPVSGGTGNTTPAPRDTRKPTNDRPDASPKKLDLTPTKLKINRSSPKKLDLTPTKLKIDGPDASPKKLDLTPTKLKIDRPDASKKLDLTPTNFNSVEPEECTTRDNYPGRCVNYYQCNQKTKTIIEDGTSSIDIRSSRCQNYLHICCRLSNLNDTSSTATPLGLGGEISDKERLPDRHTDHIDPVTETLNVATEEVAPQCGYSNPGIHTQRSNTGYAKYGDFPYMVAILKKSRIDVLGSQAAYLGGGTLIHPSVVITVAHKLISKKRQLDPDELECRAGEWDTQTTLELYPYQERDVAKFIIHEEYYRPSLFADIALLIMTSPFTLKGAPHIGTGCLGKVLPPDTYNCYSMGWGGDFLEKKKYPVVLKKIELQYVSHDRCQHMLRTNSRLGKWFSLHDTLTCANGAKGVEMGDGGSPLVCPVSTKPGEMRYAVYGMTAYGVAQGNPLVPGVYVNVPNLRSWVNKKMHEEGFDSQYYTIN
ncbi:uncharacterized protein [Epargyreus clarus]|uniref:uncharacterized protein n=1 Tax=Epargyreus clarus TaxID=520877 RepID=UPI003C2D959C